MELIKDYEFYSHMPFIFNSNTILFARSPKECSYYELQGGRFSAKRKTRTPFHPWHICVGKLDMNSEIKVSNIRRIFKFTKLDDVYCSPQAFLRNDGKIQIGACCMPVGGIGKFKFTYLTSIANGFNDISVPVITQNETGVKPYCLVENVKYKACANTIRDNTFFVLFNKNNGDVTKIKIGGIGFMRRLSFVSREPESLLITYPYLVQTGKKSLHKTIKLNLLTMEIVEVLAETSDLYKCSIFKNLCIWAEKGETEDKYCCLHYSEFKTRLIKLPISKSLLYNTKKTMRRA